MTLQTQNAAILKILVDFDAQVEERVLRRKETGVKKKINNLIMCKVPESEKSGEDRRKEDEKVIGQIFGEIGADLVGQKLTDELTEIKRLGSQMTGKVRPLKVVFKSTVARVTIISLLSLNRECYEKQKI